MISFTVYGTPIPQGSTKALIPKGWDRAIITADNKKTKPWRQEIASLARNFFPYKLEGAVLVECRFYFEKPKSTKKSVVNKITKPDIDKLARAVLDSLTGIAYADDSQVTTLVLWKGFGTPRLDITVSQP